MGQVVVFIAGATRGAFCFAYSPSRTPTLFLPRIWASCLSAEGGRRIEWRRRRAGRRCRPGPGRGPLPLSKEHLMDTSRLKNILPLPRQTKRTTDQKAEQGKEGPPTPICKQISAMQSLPPSFIKMNCSGVERGRGFTALELLL